MLRKEAVANSGGSLRAARHNGPAVCEAEADYRTNGGRPNPLPQLTIKGRWLEALGFAQGQSVCIIAEHGQLIIRTAPAMEGNA
ncbi:SymE family type I addiction module toxin [Serratia sp. D1N4]